ncbi:MAG: SIR2 family protein [Acidobacteriia bacterium]|nr:SIR2 family protein [Terriglobia bacterium]
MPVTHDANTTEVAGPANPDLKHHEPEAAASHWSTLIGKIRAGLCTPILGAGAAFETLPLAAELAEELLQEEEAQTGKKAPLPGRTDLAKVTEYIAVQREDNVWPKVRIAELLKRRGTPDFNSPDEPHRTLAALRLPIYLTTNYDDFMYKALVASGVQPVREIARWNSELMENVESQFDKGYEPSPECPLVFHIHGHWDLPESMVATEDDYLDFLVSIARDLATSPTDTSKKAILPTRVRRALKGSTLMFLGYSVADINFRVILRGLVGSLSPALRQMSLSVQYCSGEPGDLEKYIEDYFGHTLKLHIFWSSARQFCHDINQKLHAADQQQPFRSTKPSR